MIDLRLLDRHRDRSPEILSYYAAFSEEVFGHFWFRSPVDKAPLHVVASNGDGWDHVSVSRKNRPPNWTEMDFIKRTFFKPHEVAMQLHVAESDHISIHPNCLHLWRPHDREIPLPPAEFV